MITDGLKAMTEMMERDSPLAFKAVYPRNIVPPGGYANPKHYSTLMLGHLLTVLNENMRQLSHATGYMTSLLLVGHKVPTYFVSYEFCQAVANTDLPSDFQFSELKWPLPAQLFVLPDQFVKLYYGVYAPFLAICRADKGNYPSDLGKMPPSEIEFTQVDLDIPKIVFDYPVYYPNRLPTDFNGNYPLNAGVEIFKDAPWCDSTAYEHAISGINYAFNEEELTPEQEKVFIDKALQFAIKLLLCVAARPAAVERGSMTRPAKIKHGHERKELWSPNVIGRAYRIPREQRNAQTVAASERRAFKFRRGHYTWQAKRFKNVEFISVENMPRNDKGGIDFQTAGPDLTSKFHTVHERIWIEGIIRENEA